MAGGADLAALCTASTFVTSPDVLHSAPGVAVADVAASLETDFSAETPWYYNFNRPGRAVAGATFCNITVTYTHPGHGGDAPTHVRAYLPISSPA